MAAGIIPFGALPQFAGLSPDDLARVARSQQPTVPSPVDGLLFDRSGLGGQGGFSGTSGTIVPPAATAQPEPETGAPAARAMPTPPVRPLTFGRLPTAAPAAPDTPVAPVAPASPATTGTAPAASSSTASAAAPSAADPSFLDRIGDGLRNLNSNGGGDLLMSIGMGLMSTPGWGRGVAAGLKNYQDNEGKRAASDLARAEFGLKVRKDAQEQRQLSGNAQYVASKIPGISPEQALTLGGNSAFMNELFKGVLPPTELYKQYTDADGNRWNRNERTGQETIALKKDDDKTVTPVPEADRVALGLPAGSYQKDANGKISPINATGTTINMGAEKAQDATVGKAYGDYQVDLATKGRNAGNTLNSLALMEQAARNPNFYSGTGAETVKRANQFLVAMGVKDANYTKPTEVFDALSNKVVLDGLGGSLGPGISNTDRDYIGRTAPTLAQSQAGNLELIAIARSLAQRQQAVSKLARDYAANNGGRLDSGFDQKLEEYAGANPLFPAAQAAATQRSDGATGASGPGGIAAPRSQADFDALPKGAMYVDPSDGRRYRKN
ncbi:hypothetical protein ABID82_002367 [Methylobacterium sp. PvP062]